MLSFDLSGEFRQQRSPPRPAWAAADPLDLGSDYRLGAGSAPGATRRAAARSCDAGTGRTTASAGRTAASARDTTASAGVTSTGTRDTTASAGRAGAATLTTTAGVSSTGSCRSRANASGPARRKFA